MNNYIQVVPHTWAYIQGQLDFARSRWVKVHIIDEENYERTLCGKPCGNWELGDYQPIPVTGIDDDDCKVCFGKLMRLRINDV